ncbi:MAG: phosphoadenylyl-sulfate reductase [Bryobacteraceae bacterium]|nr:phosphoadenylyl-sulfate reductase [Bryobacteraceae bacterium]
MSASSQISADTPQEGSSAEELLRWAIGTYRERFAILTSFQSEGMVLVDMAVKIEPRVRVITLDTGRLPAETYGMIETVRELYGIPVEMVGPDAEETGRMTTRFGPNLFREEVAYRRLCCEIRKVRPFATKLPGLDAYAVGLRRAQGTSRENIAMVDFADSRYKLSPLATWSQEDVAAYTREHQVPVHPLYEAGYTSIGCEPCTRAIGAGESERAGRWWWELDGNSECGLHFSAEGRVERSVDVLLREILTN